MSPRIRESVKRHGVTLGLVLALLAVVDLAAPTSAPPLVPAADGSYPLLHLLRALADLTDPGLIGWLLGAAAAVAVFALVWRLTRNRIVSVSAAVLAAAHPALVTLPAAATLSDRVALLAAAGALACQIAPPAAAPRIANRAPSPFRPRTFAVLLLASAATPDALLLPPLVVLLEYVHRGRPTGAKSAARGLAVYAVPFFASLLLALAHDGPAAGVAERIAAAFALDAPGDAFAHLRLHAILWAGLAVLAVDRLTGLGRRKVLVLHGAFAGGTLALCTFGGALLDLGGGALGGPLAFLGWAVLIPVAAWRVLMQFFPDPAPIAAPRPPPTWSELRASLPLQPLPDLAAARAAAPQIPAIGRTPRSEDDLVARALAGRSHLGTAWLRETVRPRLAGGRSLAVLTPPGALPPAVVTLVAAARTAVVLVPSLDAPEPDAAVLAGLPGVRTLRLRAAGDWPLLDAEADVVVLDAADGDADPAELLMEAARVVAPKGFVAGALALDPGRLAAWAEQLGLEVVAVETLEGGVRFQLERRP